MIEVSFVEIKPNFTKTEDLKYQHNNIIDVTDRITEGHYIIDTPFTIIYLYDLADDTKSVKFLTKYGGKLHTRSSKNVTILTHVDSKMVHEWGDVIWREEIRSRDIRPFQAFRDLKEFYKIDDDKLPAMIIIKQNRFGDEESCIVDLSNQKYSEDDLFNAFIQTIEMIEENCEKDFSKIVSLVNGSYDNDTLFDGFNTYNYIYQQVKEYNKKPYCSCTQESLARELGISPRTLNNKRTNNTFTRDECIYIGIKFGLTIDKLNTLLKVNKQDQLGFNGRDSIIRDGLLNRENIVRINLVLANNHFNKVLEEK